MNDIQAKLSRLRDPASGKTITELGLTPETIFRGEDVFITLVVDPAMGPKLEDLRQMIEREVMQDCLGKVSVVLTAEKASPKTPTLAEGVKHIIAVASGKGGVGKSTVAVNLAVAFSKLGQKVGLLDADIYGPSVPRLVGQRQGKPVQTDKIQPVSAHGLSVMSIGFMVDEETPMIWRGPMVQSALLQMLRDVDWAGTDILVIDMPPGTGDAQLTLAQKVPLSGAVIVSTPQDIALLDARKGLEMFRKVNVPILGIVENMSFFCCPNCGHQSNIFGHGGAQAEAQKLGAPFLGAIPLLSDIRLLSDAGTPITAAKPTSEAAKIYLDIAGQVLDGLTQSTQKPSPNIVFI